MIAILTVWISWFLGPLFAYAAIAKALQFQRFRAQVASLGTVPDLLSWPITLGVLAGESGLAALLMTGVGPAPAFLGAAGLLLIFTAFVGWAVATGRKIACYCFGDDGASISLVTLVRNLALLAAAVAGGALALYATPAPPVGLALPPWEAVVAGAYGVSSGLLFLAAHQLAALWAASRRFV
jgi:putative oxidoreductase